MKKTVITILLMLATPACLALQANFNGDSIINFKDLTIFANDWAKTSGFTDPNTDLNADGTVDYKDLYIFAGYWLEFVNLRTLTITSSAGGTVTTPGIGTYNYDVNSYANITASAGSVDFNFSNWTGSAATAGKVNDVNAATTIVLMDANYTVQANFIGVYGLPPTANEANITAFAYITKDINLANYASDDGIPAGARLIYIIVSIPNDVNVYLQDPASGCGKITVGLLPYTLRNHGSTVWLAADNNEVFSFKYKVNDTIYDSCDANCTVVVAENPHDGLSFDGGFATIPDNILLDLEPKRAIGICFNTRTPFCNLLRKHEPCQPGYDVNIVSGKIVANIYDANGIAATIKSNYRYDNGQWANAVIAYDSNAHRLEFYTGFGALIPDSNWYSEGELFWRDTAVSLPAGTYSNDCNLVIGAGFKGEIDAIRTYTFTFLSSDNFRSLTACQSRETAGDADWQVPVPIVQFKCNEGSGGTITDEIESLVGVISDSNTVKWTPWNWYWADINVLRRNR